MRGKISPGLARYRRQFAKGEERDGRNPQKISEAGPTGSSLVAVSPGSVQAAPATAKHLGGPEGEDYYDKLEVTKIINAAGTYTALTVSDHAPSGASGGGAGTPPPGSPG